MKSVFCVVLILAGSATPQDSLIYSISEGSVHFRSAAPLEVIQAESSELRGLLDFNKHTFAFSVGISSFKGFNSARSTIESQERSSSLVAMKPSRLMQM